jgi:hypothetical protein
MAFWAEVIPMTNLCDVCGKPATQSMLRDLFGKSDEMRFVCSDHGFRIRDPADVAAIDQLHAALKTAQELAATRLMEVERQKAALVEAWNETHTASIEIERLRGEAEVADEQLAQLRGFAEAHKNCRGSDEPGVGETFPPETLRLAKEASERAAGRIPGNPLNDWKLGEEQPAQGASRDASSEPAKCSFCGETKIHGQNCGYFGQPVRTGAVE